MEWESPPSNERFIELLQKSDHRVLAFEDKKLVGFVTAISDGVLAAYISFLEVLPEYQGKGIGKELVDRMLAEFKGYYMIRPAV